MHLRYLTIEFGLGFFSFSLLFLSCLSSAQCGSHLTHSLLHMHSLGGQLQSQHQNILRMAMSSPPPLLLTLSFATPRLVQQHARAHMATRTNPSPRQGRARQLLSVHRETKRERERERWQGEKLRDVREKSGRVGGMRAKPEGGGGEREE